ncbi:MAG: tRNA (guanosine(37)-N1)-methyltransferase TrmD [Actinomycetota bacterium]|nr:tRNA (guanosine(37)-N1)-methyltransferase TrmD [Actinomycetota bacterium]
MNSFEGVGDSSKADIKDTNKDIGLSVDVLTLFPNLIEGYASESILGRARSGGYLTIRTIDIRDFAKDRHRSVDDTPYGGGAGMVMMAEPIFDAVESSNIARPLFLLAPWGRRLDQGFAQELRDLGSFSLLCGRYEGVDARVEDHLVDGAISLGDFVLAGGELAALAVIEATARLVDGVLGNSLSAYEESFSTPLLEAPQYTKPAMFRDLGVPEVLLSGDHGKIAKWRRDVSIDRTSRLRPDLLEKNEAVRGW